MGELLAVTCDACCEPMVPNVSTLDDDGCGWICLSPGCPELAAGVEAEDLAGDWVSTSAGTGSMSKTRRSPAVSRGWSITAWTRRRRAAVRRTRPHGRASARRPSSRVSTRICASWGAWPRAREPSPLTWTTPSSSRTTRGDFDEAEQTRQTLAVVGALCAVLRRTAGDAQDRHAGIDSELPGLFIANEA